MKKNVEMIALRNVRLWEKINKYTSTCGGNPSRNIFNVDRQKIVTEIEEEIDSMRRRDDSVERLMLGMSNREHEEELEQCREQLIFMQNKIDELEKQLSRRTTSSEIHKDDQEISD